MADETRSRPWSGLVITLAAAIITTAVGYAAGFLNDRREAELRFVNDQIEKLYGPLYALSTANDVSWDHFRTHNWPRAHGPYFDDRNPPNTDQIKVWRTWIREVFQPQNRLMSDVIVKNSQLIIGGTMPKQFRDMISHTAAYDATIAGWKDDLDAANCRKSSNCPYLTERANTAMVNAPGKFGKCVQEDYVRLKELQQQLRSTMILIRTAKIKRLSVCD